MKTKNIFGILIIVLLLISCTNNSYIIKPNMDCVETINTSIKKEMTNKTSVNHEISDVTLTAVGDIMCHIQQLYRGYNKIDDSFNFAESFKYIEKYISNSDYTIGNLETTFAGKNKGRNYRPYNDYMGYKGYPCFNTPEILAQNLKEVGFDLVSTCNNHSLDSKYEGILSTLDYLDEQGINHVGTYRNQLEADKIFIKEIKGIKFAFLAYTYGTNGFLLPEDKSYLVNTLDMYDEEKVNQMIEKVIKAHNSEADVVIAILHFGNEYCDFPNSYQKNIVDKLFEAGADVIIGSHPHVLQPLEIRDIKSNNGTIRKGVVIYSLGNFISSQRYSENNPANTDIGAILNVNFRKIDNHTPEIMSVSFVPTCTYRNKNELAVLPVDEVLDNISSYNLNINEYGMNRLRYSHYHTYKHLLSYIDTEYIYEKYKYTIKIIN
ncbi:MAG: CapA family protein [Vallitalea sp.]|nr:CapA family protein [Vallitalea sp.]